MILERFLIVSAILFAIGLYGVLSRRNVITVLMSLEIMFNAVVLASISMSRYILSYPLSMDPSNSSELVLSTLLTGQVFGLFIITVAAAEIALGLGIVIAMYRHRETVDVNQANLMSG